MTSQVRETSARESTFQETPNVRQLPRTQRDDFKFTNTPNYIRLRGLVSQTIRTHLHLDYAGRRLLGKTVYKQVLQDRFDLGFSL
ncbi:hypothetical protein J6590_034341, partial [Homalodisca vitripennis]